MPPTVITTEAVVGPYTATPVAANFLDIAFTAADVANGNSFVVDANGDILIVWNTDTASHNFTLTSQTDSPYLRVGDITTYAVGAGVVSMYNLQPNVDGAPSIATSLVPGWTDFFNTVYFSADNALVKFAII